jgi:hypothetical protein
MAESGEANGGSGRVNGAYKRLTTEDTEDTEYKSGLGHNKVAITRA